MAKPTAKTTARRTTAGSTGEKQRELQRKQELYEAQLNALRSEFEPERDAILRELEDDYRREGMIANQRVEMARMRHADVPTAVEGNGARKARKGSQK